MTNQTACRGGVYVAVDGGGTKTTLIVGDEAGRILAHVRGGSSNMKSVPWERVREELDALLAEGLRSCGVAPEQVRGITLGLAGGDRSEDKERVGGLLRSRLPRDTQIQLFNDAQTALAAGTQGRRGLVLISGTGSICCGFDPGTGEYVRVGGWGYILGDEGSGFDLGRRTLQAVMHAYDGRGAATLLTDEVLQTLGLDSPEQLVTHIYEADNMRARVASLSHALFRAARQGDSIASGIAAGAADDLARLVKAACAALSFGGPGVPLVLSGGVFAEPALLQAFKKHAAIWELAPELIVLKAPPVLGSYYYALAGAGVVLQQDIIDQATRYWENGSD